MVSVHSHAHALRYCGMLTKVGRVLAIIIADHIFKMLVGGLGHGEICTKGGCAELYTCI